MGLNLASLWNRGLALCCFTDARTVFSRHMYSDQLSDWMIWVSVCYDWSIIFITWQCNFHWPASLSIWASSEGGLSMRSFLGVRLQTRTLLSSNPPDRRLESSDILTVFKLREKQEDLKDVLIHYEVHKLFWPRNKGERSSLQLCHFHRSSLPLDIMQSLNLMFYNLMRIVRQVHMNIVLFKQRDCVT